MRRVIVKAVMLAMAVSLVALILTRSLPAYLETVAPHWALALTSSDANAQLQIVDAAVLANIGLPNGSYGASDRRQPPQYDAKKLRKRIMHALYNEPLSARGFEVLGALSAHSDKAATEIFMRAASRRSLHAPAALYWLMFHRYREGDLAGSVAFADVLLRIRPSTMPLVGPVLSQIAGMPAGSKLIVATLAKGPQWRRSFFRYVNSVSGNDRIALELLLDLRISAMPPSEEERNAYLWALAGRKRFELAYYAWLQFLEPKKRSAADFLFNRKFSFVPQKTPFDWSIRNGRGVLTEIVRNPDRPGENVLSIELGSGRVNFHAVSQTLVLGPGEYEFSGFAKGDLNGPRGLEWQIVCLVPSFRVVAETPSILGPMPQWSRFSARFEVARGCHAQLLQLVLNARSQSETLLSGVVAFSDLKLTRN